MKLARMTATLLDAPMAETRRRKLMARALLDLVRAFGEQAKVI